MKKENTWKEQYGWAKKWHLKLKKCAKVLNFCWLNSNKEFKASHREKNQVKIVKTIIHWIKHHFGWLKQSNRQGMIFMKNQLPFWKVLFFILRILIRFWRIKIIISIRVLNLILFWIMFLAMAIK